MRVAPLEMDANSRPSTSTASEPVLVEFIEADIPGVTLDEPLDMHNIAILCWWLQCHGVKAYTFVENKTLGMPLSCFHKQRIIHLQA